MGVGRIIELLGRLEGEASQQPRDIGELREQVVSSLGSLATRVQEIQSMLRSAELGPSAAPVELAVAALAEELSIVTAAPPARDSRKGHPLVSWRDMANGTLAGELGAWAPPAFEQITQIIGDKEFPCIFARQATNLRSGWLCFVDSIVDQHGKERVRDAVLSYLAVLERFPRERTVIMPLLVIVKPEVPRLARQQYFEQAWSLFQYLHEHDPEPWPATTPTDPDRGDWSFCFAGTQLFSNVSDPAHTFDKVRNLGDSLVFAMQPRTNFDVVASATPKGRAVRTEIRQRAERYQGHPPRHLGFYGTPENREWLQMATSDGDDTTFPKECPFRFKDRKDKGTGE